MIKNEATQKDSLTAMNRNTKRRPTYYVDGMDLK